MAESSLQQHSSELSDLQSKSQDCAQLLQTLYTGVVHLSSSLTHSLMTASEESSAAPVEPLPKCQITVCDLALPDQATVSQLLTHFQQVVSRYTDQSEQLESTTRQLEADSADCAKAVSTLAGIIESQGCVQIKQKSLHPKKPVLQLLQLSECVAAALNDQYKMLTQSQSQVECMSQQLSQAQKQRQASEAELVSSQEQLQEAIKQSEAAQSSMRQARYQHCIVYD